jgi:hypothetical protein
MWHIMGWLLRRGAVAARSFGGMRVEGRPIVRRSMVD